MLYEMINTLMVPATDIVDVVTVPAGLFLAFHVWMTFTGVINRIFS